MTSRMQIATVVLAACVTGLVPQRANGQGAAQAAGTQQAREASAAAPAEAHQAWLRGTATELAQAGGARRLALAALLVSIADSELEEAAGRSEARGWLERASLLAGNDAVANLMLAGGTASNVAGLGPAHRAAAAARWRAAEPDNLAPLLYLELKPTELVAAGAVTSRFDLHYMEAIRWMAGALAEHPPSAAVQAALDADASAEWPKTEMTNAERATLMAATMVTAFAIPNLQQLMAACAAEVADADPRHRAACERIAATMRRASDTVLGADMGRALAWGLALPDERRELDAEQRQRAWSTRQFAAATSGEGALNLVPLHADPTIDTEQALTARAIAEAGLPSAPPDGWKAPGKP
jgi:hypothetical protein